MATKMRDGWYVIWPEGCAWIAVCITDGMCSDTIEQANAETHIAARDQYAETARAIMDDRTTSVGDNVARRVVRVYGGYLDPDYAVVERVCACTTRYRVYAATTEQGGVQGLGQGDEYYEAATAAEAAQMAADDWGWDADDWDGGDVIVATDDAGDSYHLSR